MISSIHTTLVAVSVLSLYFYERGFLEVVTSGVSAIASIAASYHEKGVDKSVYAVADRLMVLWHVRVLAEAKEDVTTIAAIDEILRQSKIWQADDAEDLKRVFEERKWQLKRELTEVHGPLFDDPTTVLKRVLTTQYPAMIDRFLKEVYRPGT